jgi:hypothetical protein
MTWTYNAASLSLSDLYKVRFLIGDTDSARQQLQDEEIDWVLSEQSIVTYAAAACAENLAAKYAFLVNTENSELRVSAAARHKHYLELAERLRKHAGDLPGGDGSNVVLATAYAGGVYQSEKDALDDNADLVGSTFSIGQDDHPEGGNQTT